MPLYVRSSAGPRTLHGIDGLASPSNPRDVEILGPYPEEKLLDILDSARMHSARHKTLKTREVIWVCGKRVPVVLRVYVDGKRVFPKGSRGDRLKPRFKALQECLTRSGSARGQAKGNSHQGQEARVGHRLSTVPTVNTTRAVHPP